MQVNHFLPGEVVRISLSIKDAAGVAAVPGGVQLVVQGPDLVRTVVSSIQNPEAGNYYADFQLPPTSPAGVWSWRWDLSPPNAGASEGMFQVKRSLMM